MVALTVGRWKNTPAPTKPRSPNREIPMTSSGVKEVETVRETLSISA